MKKLLLALTFSVCLIPTNSFANTEYKPYIVSCHQLPNPNHVELGIIPNSMEYDTLKKVLDQPNSKCPKYTINPYVAKYNVLKNNIYVEESRTEFDTLSSCKSAISNEYEKYKIFNTKGIIRIGFCTEYNAPIKADEYFKGSVFIIQLPDKNKNNPSKYEMSNKLLTTDNARHLLLTNRYNVVSMKFIENEFYTYESNYTKKVIQTDFKTLEECKDYGIVTMQNFILKDPVGFQFVGVCRVVSGKPNFYDKEKIQPEEKVDSEHD